jgi:hypothetical protein
MKIIRTDAEGFPIQQGGDAWKQLRVGMFTGTSIGDLIVGPRGGTKMRDSAIAEVVSELLTGKPVSGFKATKYVKEGIEKEPFARMLYEERTGYIVEEVAFIRHDWIRAGVSPDGLVLGRKRGTEFKSPKETTHVQYLMNPKLLVDEYFSQTQSNLWLSAYEAWDLCSYHPDFEGGMQLLVVEVLPDLTYHKKLEDVAVSAHAEVNAIVKDLRKKFNLEEMKA